MINIKCNYLILFILLFTGLIASGCSKWSSGTTTVEFVIINPANGEPFPDVNVKIVEETSTNNKSRVMCEGKTDASGRITFDFTAKRTSKYWYYPYIDYDSFGIHGKDYSILKRPTVLFLGILSSCTKFGKNDHGNDRSNEGSIDIDNVLLIMLKICDITKMNFPFSNLNRVIELFS